MPTQTSVDFGFLAAHDERIAIVAAQAERLFAEDPHAALSKLRLFGELLARLTAANAGLYTTVAEPQVELLGRLSASGVIKRDTAGLFHLIRKSGNVASHDLVGGHREALQLLRFARELGVWLHRMSGAPADFRPGPFVPPADPREETKALAEELSRLRQALAEAKGRGRSGATRSRARGPSSCRSRGSRSRQRSMGSSGKSSRS